MGYDDARTFRNPAAFDGFNDSGASIRRTMDVINRAAGPSLPGVRRAQRRAVGVALAASLALAPVTDAAAQSRGGLIRDAEIEGRPQVAHALEIERS